ncbi:MAG: endonuclease domain-containing protein [Nitrospirota bacterium]
MMTERIHNRNVLKERRKQLRNSLTPAEAKLWSLLKDSQLENRKFRRQHSIGPYVLDFYCPSEKLCVEMDGAGHFTDGGYEYDTERTEYFKNLNIKVIRFENKDIFDNAEGILEEIRKFFHTNHPCPSLTKEGNFAGEISNLAAEHLTEEDEE